MVKVIEKLKALDFDCKFNWVYRGVIFTTAALAVMFILTVGYMVFPWKVIDIENFEVYNSISGDMKEYSIPAGEEIEFEVVFNKHINAVASLTVLLKQIGNGYLYPFPEVRVTRMPIGKHHYNSSLIIPKGTPPGRYVLIRTYRYIVNPLRTVDTEVTSNEFRVTKPVKLSVDVLKLIESGNNISLENQKELKEIKKEIKKSNGR